VSVRCGDGENRLRGLWAEPRPAHAPVRVWRDWALVAGLVSGSVLELLLREDRAWWPLVLSVSLVIALTLLWRRTHPLAAAAVAFGTMLAFDVAKIFVIDATGLLTIAGLLVLPYALFRWGSGREAAVGLGIILGWLPVTHVADPTASAQAGLPPSEVVTVVGGYGFFLFSAALGASIRFYAHARVRDIEQAKLRQRNELARELHDAVGHHVSAIAIQAQAGRALSASHPDRALATLETIEEAASRTLQEMRDGGAPARRGGTRLRPATGAGRHRTARPRRRRVAARGRAGGRQPLRDQPGSRGRPVPDRAGVGDQRGAPRPRRDPVTVQVADEDEQVRLTVRDDGAAGPTGHTPAGYGLVGMAERASLLGGTLQAGPDPDGGWTVRALLPKGVVTT
jgi:signal transduction histidine kinase